MSDLKLPTTATGAVKTALDWKLLLVVFIIAVIVAYLMSKVFKNEIVIKDSQGNITGKGEIQQTLNKSILPDFHKEEQQG